MIAHGLEEMGKAGKVCMKMNQKSHGYQDSDIAFQSTSWKNGSGQLMTTRDGTNKKPGEGQHGLYNRDALATTITLTPVGCPMHGQTGSPI